jgi:hypothetical protein
MPRRAATRRCGGKPLRGIRATNPTKTEACGIAFNFVARIARNCRPPFGFGLDASRSDNTGAISVTFSFPTEKV